MMQIQEDTTGIEVAGLPYKTLKDKHGVEHKVIDLNDEGLMPRTGQIIYEANKKGQRTIGHGYHYSMTTDQGSGVEVGICTGIDSKTGDLRWLRMTLGSLNTFDLSVRQEREKAIVLKYSSIVEGSPNLSFIEKLHLFRVHDSEKAAHLEIQKIQDGQRALNIASGLYGEELLNMARNIGVMPEGNSILMLNAAVLRAARDTPKDFLALWENPNRELITTLKRCLDTGVISNTPLDGYTYEGRPLGHNEPAVLDFMTKYRDVAMTLDMKSKEKLKQSEKSMAKTGPIKSTSDTEAENMLLRKQLTDMQNQISRMSANSIREEETAPDPVLVEELENVRAEAALLKTLKGLHHFQPTRESIDKLKEKVRQAKITPV